MKRTDLYVLMNMHFEESFLLAIEHEFCKRFLGIEVKVIRIGVIHQDMIRHSLVIHCYVIYAIL